jgi:putative transposase
VVLPYLVGRPLTATEVYQAFGYRKSAYYKAGTRVVTVPAQYTSQRCSACGQVDPKSRESQAVFRCTHCSRPAEHADVNAAKNILAAGLAVTACEDTPQPAGWVVLPKQEPARNREELLFQPDTAA